ncbi:MAG TPA: hypothetical protein VN886_20425 [Acidimicrobiales bacterium]|nr:hypothetical protein [Acidimicrobiales bacterium]
MKLATTPANLWRGSSSRLGLSVVAGLLLLAAAGCGGSSSDDTAGAPTLTITSGPYRDGQLVNLSVGPNHYFTKYAEINIVQCADPGGTEANLPRSSASCDGNTAQGPSVLVNANGSFSFHGYEIWALPNESQLDEAPDSQPVCNRTHSCVLYVGQDTNIWTKPKIFSPPFTVTPKGKSSS